MYRIVIFLILLLSCTAAFCANKTWDGGGADDRWLTPENWDEDTIPAAGDLVYLNEPDGLILIESGDTIKCNKILGPSRTNCVTTLTMTGGSLTNPSYWKVATAAGGQGIVNIHGGTITTRDLLLGAGGGNAIVNMTGGTMNITGTSSTVGLIMPFDENSSATFNISGGIITIGSLNLNSASEFSPALIDIGTEAEVRILGDVRALVQSHISNGYIKANGGNAMVLVRYDGTYTTLLSSLNPDVPVAANPSPANGQTDVPVIGTILSWQGGTGITKHNVYIGENESSLSLVSHQQTGVSFVPGPLNFDTEYYWRIDEVQDTDVITGMLWNFRTKENILVDNFEDYTDTGSLKALWKDGSLDGSSGSEIQISTAVINNGSKACAFSYDNTGAIGGKYHSEIETVPKIADFLINNVKDIDLWYNGAIGNSSQPMYITLSDGINSAMLEKSNASQADDTWTVWQIDLAEFKAVNPDLNLSSITKMLIGIGSKSAVSSGGQGTIYIDDIALWPARCITKYVADLNSDCKVDIEDLAVMAIQWLRDGTKEKIMDTTDSGFSQSGFTMVQDAHSWNGNQVAVSSGSGSAISSARYSPKLNGRYDVYMFWRDYDNKDTITYWTVKHARGTTTTAPTQLNTPGWNLHGTYELNQDSYIELEGSRKQDAQIVADAVKFVPAVPTEIYRIAKDTITPAELNIDDVLNFTLRNGQTRKIKLVSTEAHIVDYPVFSFSAQFDIDGSAYIISRSVPTQDSFYEPTVINGMRLWLDAVTDMFQDDGGWMLNKDRYLPCRPKRKARIVVNDVSDRICPENIVWWYPETKDRIIIEECYDGNDTWLGPYGGNKAHGGLDINMTNGTSLFAPISFDDQYYFDSLAAGDDNNRWRGIRNWPDGSIWWLQSHHLNQLLITEHQPLAKGVHYAYTAGVKVGGIPHTHFAFRIFEDGQDYLIDPWIFFWQTFRDN